MRSVLLIAACALLVSGCESTGCKPADWAEVGERDAVLGAQGMAERYSQSCGGMFQAAPYQEGFQKGFARRPKPSV